MTKSYIELIKDGRPARLTDLLPEVNHALEGLPILMLFHASTGARFEQKSLVAQCQKLLTAQLRMSFAPICTCNMCS